MINRLPPSAMVANTASVAVGGHPYYMISVIKTISLSGKWVCNSPSIRVSEISIYYENRWGVPTDALGLTSATSRSHSQHAATITDDANRICLHVRMGTTRLQHQPLCATWLQSWSPSRAQLSWNLGTPYGKWILTRKFTRTLSLPQTIHQWHQAHKSMQDSIFQAQISDDANDHARRRTHTRCQQSHRCHYRHCTTTKHDHGRHRSAHYHLQIISRKSQERRRSSKGAEGTCPSSEGAHRSQPPPTEHIRNTPFTSQDDHLDTSIPAENTRLQCKVRTITQDYLFHMMDTPDLAQPFTNKQATACKYPLQFLCDYTYAVRFQSTSVQLVKY